MDPIRTNEGASLGLGLGKFETDQEVLGSTILFAKELSSLKQAKETDEERIKREVRFDLIPPGTRG